MRPSQLPIPQSFSILIPPNFFNPDLPIPPSTMKTSQTLICFLALLLCIASLASAADDSIATKCAAEFQKVTPCLAFATAKAATPGKDCCDSVTALKNTDPACICFIIQQIHNGTNEAIKSMGIQESRLLQLSSACHLANASISECPKLLHLPPNSPDAAIFNNATAAAAGSSPPAGGSSGGGGSVAAGSTPGSGIWHKPQLAVCVLFTGVAFFMGFPGGRSLVPAA